MKKVLIVALMAVAFASSVSAEIAIPQSVHDFYDMCEPSKSNSNDELI